MSDYISREAALSAQYKSMNLKEMRERLKRIPAADVAPVVHGCWMDHVNPRNDDDWACSNCGSYFVFEAGDPIANGTNYCPNCGAKMDGGDHDAAD